MTTALRAVSGWASPYVDTAAGAHAGTVHVFVRMGTTWTGEATPFGLGRRRERAGRRSWFACILLLFGCAGPAATDGAVDSDAGNDAAHPDAGVDAAIQPDAAPPMGCTGTFGAPELVLAADGFRSPAVTADELELFYARRDTFPHEFRVSTRASRADAFVVGDVVVELESSCVGTPTREKQIEVSSDGLRVYFACGEGATGTAQPIFVASRASRGDAFVVDPTPVTQIFGGFSLAQDELTIYSNDPSSGAVFATRSSTTQPFGAYGPIAFAAGRPSAGFDLAPDGLSLVASQIGTGAFSFFTRTDVASAFVDSGHDLPAVPGSTAAGAPEFTADCRSVYFVASNPTTGRFEIYATRR